MNSVWHKDILNYTSHVTSHQHIHHPPSPPILDPCTNPSRHLRHRPNLRRTIQITSHFPPSIPPNPIPDPPLPQIPLPLHPSSLLLLPLNQPCQTPFHQLPFLRRLPSNHLRIHRPVHITRGITPSIFRWKQREGPWNVVWRVTLGS